MTDWGTAGIVAELNGAARGYDVADGALADGSEYAARARKRMLFGNMRGIAGGISTIKTAIDRDRAHLGQIAGRFPPLTTAVGTVTDTSTPTEVVATLTPVLADIDTLDTTTLAAEQTLHHTETLIRTNLHGGQPEHLLAFVGRAKSVLAAVRTHLAKAKKSTTETLRLAHTAGTTPGAGANVLLPADMAPHARTEPLIGNQVPDPNDRTGARIHSGSATPSNAEPGARKKRSALNRLNDFVDKTVEKGDDAGDALKQGVEGVVRGISHPPTGHQVSTGVQASPPPSQHLGVPDIVQAVALTAAVTYEGIKMSVDRVRRARSRKRNG